MVSEDPTKQWSHNRCNTVNCSDETLVDGSFVERNNIHHNDDCSRKYARIPQARDGAPDDEGDRARRGTADSRPNLEETDRDQEDPFGVIEGVDPPKEQLRGTLGEQICTSVPASVAQRVKVIGDAGNSRSDNCPILTMFGQFSVRFGSLIYEPPGQKTLTRATRNTPRYRASITKARVFPFG